MKNRSLNRIRENARFNQKSSSAAALHRVFISTVMATISYRFVRFGQMNFVLSALSAREPACYHALIEFQPSEASHEKSPVA
jgi:hypothetical protein